MSTTEALQRLHDYHVKGHRVATLEALLEEAGAALAAAAPSPADPWQPIETAPKADGGLVDIMCNGRRYAGCHYDKICGEYRHITACGVLVRLGGATHWMPLPAAPGEPERMVVFDDRPMLADLAKAKETLRNPPKLQWEDECGRGRYVINAAGLAAIAAAQGGKV